LVHDAGVPHHCHPNTGGDDGESGSRLESVQGKVRETIKGIAGLEKAERLKAKC
jgi:hypothetical protein